MKLFVIGLALLASAYGEGPTVEYLPPGGASASHVVETNFLESEPAHSLSDDGYRYKTVKRFRLRHRRDVNELSSDYLPPQAASAPAQIYSAPAPAYSAPSVSYAPAESSVSFAAAPAVSYQSAPAESYAPAPAAQSYEGSYSEPEPAHTLSNDGYRYKTVKRYRLRRRRRDVNELSSEYLPPNAASAPAPAYSSPVYSAPAPAYSAPSVSFAPAEAASSVSYAAEPAVSYAQAPSFAPAEQSYDISASEPEPAHTLSNDGYRYKTVKRYRYRHRH